MTNDYALAIELIKDFESLGVKFSRRRQPGGKRCILVERLGDSGISQDEFQVLVEPFEREITELIFSRITGVVDGGGNKNISRNSGGAFEAFYEYASGQGSVYVIANSRKTQQQMRELARRRLKGHLQGFRLLGVRAIIDPKSQVKQRSKAGENKMQNRV